MSSNAPTLSPIPLMARRAAAQSGLGQKLDYTPSNGIPELRRAIRANLLAKHHLRLSFDTDEALLVEGCRRLVATLEAAA